MSLNHSKHTRSAVTGSSSVRPVNSVTRSICHLDNQWFLSDMHSWKRALMLSTNGEPNPLRGESHEEQLSLSQQSRYCQKWICSSPDAQMETFPPCFLAVSSKSRNVDEIESDRLQEDMTSLMFSECKLQRSISRWGARQCLSWLWLMAVLLIHVCCSHFCSLRGTWWTSLRLSCVEEHREKELWPREERIKNIYIFFTKTVKPLYIYIYLNFVFLMYVKSKKINNICIGFINIFIYF